MEPHENKRASSNIDCFEGGSADSAGDDDKSEAPDKEEKINSKIAEHFQLEDPKNAGSI